MQTLECWQVEGEKAERSRVNGEGEIFRQVFQEKKNMWQIGEREERTEGPSSGCLCLPGGGRFSGACPTAHRWLPDPASPPAPGLPHLSFLTSLQRGRDCRPGWPLRVCALGLLCRFFFSQRWCVMSLPAQDLLQIPGLGEHPQSQTVSKSAQQADSDSRKKVGGRQMGNTLKCQPNSINFAIYSLSFG